MSHDNQDRLKGVDQMFRFNLNLVRYCLAGRAKMEQSRWNKNMSDLNWPELVQSAPVVRGVMASDG